MGTAQFDFRDEDPVWVKYAIKQDAAHNEDKFYEVRIDMKPGGGFVVTRRWGRRPDTGVGQIKTEVCTTLVHATNVANAYANRKVHDGYWEVERPYAASNQVMRIRGADEARDEQAF